MKKIFLLLILYVISLYSIIAENSSITKNIEFNHPIPFYTYWDANEGVSPGIDVLIAKNENDFYIFSYSNYNWYHFHSNTYEKVFDITENASEIGKPIFYYYNNILIIGLINMGEEHNELNLFYNDENNQFYISKKLPQYYSVKNNGLYYTDKNLLFFLTKDKVIRLHLKSEKEIRFFDYNNTNEWLNNNAKVLGLTKIEGRYAFGDNLTDDYYKNTLLNYQKLIISDKDNESYHLINDLHYQSIGKDSYGFSYFRLVRYSEEKSPQNKNRNNIKYSIAVHNSWTNEIKIFDDYEINDWNPPRNTNNEFIGDYPWTVSSNGDIYFFDADETNKQYQIKKINNRWYKEFGLNTNMIGHCTNNNIPFYREKDKQKPIDIYNYFNDCLLIIENNNDWCKVRNIDGNEGWIETKYIKTEKQNASYILNNSLSSDKNDTIQTNVVLYKIMACKDNLRLRFEEIISSKIITTMHKGTKVRILKLGKNETIDGITSNWVQVEVIKDGLDKDGNPIKPGTIGWCYGGYLE